MDEYIKRDDLLEKLHEVRGRGAPPDTWADGFDKAIDLACVIVQMMPADDVAPVRHSRWLYHTLIDGHIHEECSECHKVRIIDNYCPNCGAKMDGGAD